MKFSKFIKDNLSIIIVVFIFLAILLMDPTPGEIIRGEKFEFSINNIMGIICVVIAMIFSILHKIVK